MNLNELLQALRDHHVELWVEGDLLRFRMPEKSLDKELLAELRHHKKALVEQLKEAAAREQSAASRLEPLSIGQQALYFLHALAPQSPAYNVAAAFRIVSPVDAAVMRKCFQTLVSRHEALRTTFEIVDGNPRCRIHSHMELDFRQVFAAGWDDEQVREAVRLRIPAAVRSARRTADAHSAVHAQRDGARLPDDTAPHHLRRLVVVAAAGRVPVAVSQAPGGSRRRCCRA